MHKEIGARHVNVGDMRAALVPMPPFAEQQRIVGRDNELMSLCDQLEASLVSGEVTRSDLIDVLLHDAISQVATVPA